MKLLIVIGTMVFVAINVAAGLIYTALIPVLDRAGLLSWSFSEIGFWLEVAVHTVITAALGGIFCLWFARSVASKIRVERTFE